MNTFEWVSAKVCPIKGGVLLYAMFCVRILQTQYKSAYIVPQEVGDLIAKHININTCCHTAH